jgi:hypothetical protein
LFSFTRLKFISVGKARSMAISNLFQLPLSEEALDQALILAQALDDLENSDSDDVWSYRWGPSFSPEECISILLVHDRYIQLSNGFGKHLCKNGIKFSFGCCLRIG